ncbi:hypothetical protein GYMLUDRAFT_83088 [Collybiopsis luxurians FD-317 M1]|nr:hypothetical protein GYMLUDRAFT_83088 [Collybiopsis luxurians FD-317 M1]
MSPRKFLVTNEWTRDPNGKIIDRSKPPPSGKRTPEGLPWGNTLDDFFWIRRIPGLNVMTIYSRSMIKELGENAAGIEHPHEPEPTVLKSWPLLKIPSPEIAPVSNENESDESNSNGGAPAHSEQDVVSGAFEPVVSDTNLENVMEVDVCDGKAENALDLKLAQCNLNNSNNETLPAQLDGTGIEAGLNSLENSSEQQTANNKRRATVNDMSPMKKKIHLEGDSGDVRDEMKAAEGTEVVEGEDTQSKIEIVKTDEAANDGAFAVNRFRFALKLPKAGVKKTQLTCLPLESESSSQDSSVSDKKVTEYTINDLSVTEENVLKTQSHTDYSTLYRLEECIPEQFLPDILLVNDPQELTSTKTFDSYRRSRNPLPTKMEKPLRYKRVWPKLARDSKPSTLFNTDIYSSSTFDHTPTVDEVRNQSNRRIAFLNLSCAPELGTGHHSVVLRGALRLPEPLSNFSDNPYVSVATKMAFTHGSEKELIEQEGKVYDAFPEHLMQSYSGFNLVPPISHPVPATACVPKFFGYYIPVDEENEAKLREEDRKDLDRRKKAKKERKVKARAEAKREYAELFKKDSSNAGSEDSAMVNTEEVVLDDGSEDEAEAASARSRIEKRRWGPTSPLLLVEECGQDIEPSDFSPDERNECFAILLRLHHANFVHNSFYVRNFLKQPGPLTKPFRERSLDSPSFRLIDFGRTTIWEDKRAGALENISYARRSKNIDSAPTKEEWEEEMKTQAERKERALKYAASKWFEERNYELGKAFKELRISNYES